MAPSVPQKVEEVSSSLQGSLREGRYCLQSRPKIDLGTKGWEEDLGRAGKAHLPKQAVVRLAGS